MTTYFCHFENFHRLLEEYEIAKTENNQQRMLDLKQKMHNWQFLCGKYPALTIMADIDKEIILTQSDRDFLEGAPFYAERALNADDLETSKNITQHVLSFKDPNMCRNCTDPNCHGKQSQVIPQDFYDVMARAMMAEGYKIKFSKNPPTPEPQPEPTEQPIYPA